MTTIKNAITELKKKKLRVIGCKESKRFYIFDVTPLRWDGTGGRPCGGEIPCLNKKTNEIETMHADEYVDLILDEGAPKNVDIMQYLDAEDVKFLKEAV